VSLFREPANKAMQGHAEQRPHALLAWSPRAPMAVVTLSKTLMSLLAHFQQRARHLKAETFALYLAARHPETPWYAKLFVAGVVAYAFSPIDLIPDFVPVLGYLDDLILIPLGIAAAIKMIPPPVLSECRARAKEIMANGKPVSRIAGVVIVVIWLALAALCIVWAYEAFK
jgi:uncharacterized membrane protein YkvA (DUF1232 family)